MKRKWLLMTMASVLTIGAFTGCSSEKEETDSSGDEPYEATLVYVVRDESAADIDKIEEKFNELTKEQLNMTVDLRPMSVGTYSEQEQLMLSTAEPVDIVCIGGSAMASTFVNGDYLTDCSDLVQEYGQDIIDIVGEDAIETCRLGDFLWGIPNMKERIMPSCAVMRTDILEELNIDVSGIKKLEDLTAVFAKVYEAHPEMKIYGGTGTNSFASMSDWCDTLGNGLGVLLDCEKNTKITNLYESDEFIEAVKLVRQWYEAGYVMKDMATTQDSSETIMKAGNLFCYATRYKPNTEIEKEAATGYDLTVVPLNEGIKTSNGTNGMSYGIGGAAKDPKKAMQLLNWIYKTEEANDLLNWGIEGEHWTETEDGTIDYPEGVTADSCGYHQDIGWAQINQFNSHVWKGNTADIWTQYEKFNDSGITSVAYGFTPDLSDYANELSALQQVTDKYVAQLGTGIAEDTDAMLKEFNDELYKNGLQKIIDAKQEQLNEWLEKNK